MTALRWNLSLQFQKGYVFAPALFSFLHSFSYMQYVSRIVMVCVYGTVLQDARLQWCDGSIWNLWRFTVFLISSDNMWDAGIVLACWDNKCLFCRLSFCLVLPLSIVYTLQVECTGKMQNQTINILWRDYGSFSILDVLIQSKVSYCCQFRPRPKVFGICTEYLLSCATLLPPFVVK